MGKDGIFIIPKNGRNVNGQKKVILKADFLKKVLTKGRERGIIIRQQRDVPVTGVCAGVAELADARDLKSRVTKVTYRFEPGVRHSLLATEYRGVEQSGSSSGS